MSDLKLTPGRTPIDLSTTKPTVSDKADIQDPRLTNALLKVSMGQALSSADAQVLSQAFAATDLPKLHKFLSIKEDNFTDKPADMIDELLDLDPFTNIPNQAATKKAKFTDEILQLEARFKALLGAEYDNSGIKNKIDQFRTALENDAQDSFETELDYRLRDQAKAKPEGRAKSKFPALDNDVLGLVIMGTSAEVAPEVHALLTTPIRTDAFRVTNIPKTPDAKSWLTYLSQAESSGLPAHDQRIARSLLRKLRDLEPESDTQTFMDLIKYLPVPADEATAQAYQKLFNDTVTTLKADAQNGEVNFSDYDSDKSLAASLEATQIQIHADLKLTEDQSITLGRAYKLLEDNTDKPLSKTVVKDAITILKGQTSGAESFPGFTAAYNSKTEDEQKVFLKQMLRKIAIDSKEKDPSTKVAIDPSTADPIKFYQDFTKTMEYLHAEINDPARSEKNRENLKDEFERFFSGGDVKPLLAEFKGADEKKELATALNLFRYDKRNLGLIKSLFNRPEPKSKSKIPVFNIVNLIRDKKNQNFNDIAQDIEVAVIISGKNGNVNQVPVELVDTSVKAKTSHAFVEAAFDPLYTTDKETKEKTPQNSFPLFSKLGIHEFLKTGKVKLSGNEMVTDKGEKIPENLRTLLYTTLASKEVGKETNDKDMIDFMVSSGVLTKSGENNYAFRDESLPLLMNLVNVGAKARHQEFLNYEGYDADTKLSYEKLAEQREKLVKLSDEKGLGIFQATPVLQPYYRSEYRDSLVSLAANLNSLKNHYDTNIRPYEDKTDERGKPVQRPDNVKSPLFGIDPARARNPDTLNRRTSSFSHSSNELYANADEIRAFRREFINSVFGNHNRRRSLFNDDGSTIKNDYLLRYPQLRNSRFRSLLG